MTTLALILAAWVVLSILVGLLVGPMFADPEKRGRR